MRPERLLARWWSAHAECRASTVLQRWAPPTHLAHSGPQRACKSRPRILRTQQAQRRLMTSGGWVRFFPLQHPQSSLLRTEQPGPNTISSVAYTFFAGLMKRCRTKPCCLSIWLVFFLHVSRSYSPSAKPNRTVHYANRSEPMRPPFPIRLHRCARISFPHRWGKSHSANPLPPPPARRGGNGSENISRNSCSRCAFGPPCPGSPPWVGANGEWNRSLPGQLSCQRMGM